MTSKCPSCKAIISENGWSTEEMDIEHHTGSRATILYCNKCHAILAVFQK